MSNRLKTICVAFVSSRFICGSFVYMAHARREFLTPVPGGWEGVKNWWINPWTTYDSEWFISIAKGGYQEHTTPFFPFYSYLLKLGGETETGIAIVGLLISNISFFFALYVLYLLTEIDFGEKTSKIAVWLLAFFPTTAFFSAVYTESLFLLLLLSSFYAARKQNWLFAGVFGFFAALTRNPGVLIFAALCLEYLKSTDYKRQKLKIHHLLYVFFPLFGFAAVQAHFWAKFGSPFAGITSQGFYYRKAGWPWEPLWKDFLGLLNLEFFNPIAFINLFFTFLIFVMIVEHRRMMRPSYLVLLLGIVLMHLSYPRTIPPHTFGSLRYMSTTFPFIQLLGFSVAQFSSWRFSPLPQLIAGMYIFINFSFSYFFGMKAFLG